MIAYVLRRIEDGKYVARPGAEHSYVRDIHNARAFDSRESAEANACGNERAVKVDYIGAFRVQS